MSNKTLKSCPFCGEELIVTDYQDCVLNGKYYGHADKKSGCYIEGLIFSVDDEEMIKRWNMRVGEEASSMYKSYYQQEPVKGD